MSQLKSKLLFLGITAFMACNLTACVVTEPPLDEHYYEKNVVVHHPGNKPSQPIHVEQRVEHVVIAEHQNHKPTFNDNRYIQRGNVNHQVIRDKYGHKIGTEDRVGNNKYIIRDKYGRKLGTEEQRRDGSYVYRDRNGVKTGTANLRNDGSFVLRDKNGHKVGTATKDMNGNYIYRDKNGRRINR